MINPFDFFLEPSAEKFPFDYAPELARRSAGPICARSNAGQTFRAYLDRISRESRQTTEFLFDLNAQLAARHRLPDPHGAGHPDARRDAGEALGLVPRLRLAAGAAAASSRARGALCLGLPDPAEARPEIARRAFGRRGRFHRSARMVRSLSARCRLGGARSDVGPVRRRRPHPARVRGDRPPRRRRSAASSRSARSSSISR